MESINLIVQKYVWKVEYPSNYCHIHLNLMKIRTLKEMMDALFISSDLHKTCVVELSFAKGNNKKFCLFRKKVILFDPNTIFFHMRNGKKGNTT